MFSIQRHIFYYIFSNLIKNNNKYIKIPKTLIPFVQSPYQNRTNLCRLGGDWTKGFTVFFILTELIFEFEKYFFNVKYVIIAGTKLFFNPSNLIPFQDIGFYHSIIGIFDFQLSNPTYEALELKSDSTIFNSSSFFLVIVLFIVIHLLILVLRRLVAKCWTWDKWPNVSFIMLKILDAIILFLTYGYYIRFILQMNQFLLISSMNEICILNTSNSVNIFSLLFAFLMLFWWISLIAFALYHSISSYKLSEDHHNKIGEFFVGVKMDKKYKLYALLLILRRTIFVVLLISFTFISSKSLVCILRIIIFIYKIELKIFTLNILNKKTIIFQRILTFIQISYIVYNHYN